MFGGGFCVRYHCVRSVQIRTFFWSVFSCAGAEYGKVWTRKKLGI